MKKGIVVFAGGIAAGKTTLSASAATLLACRHVSFSDVLRQRALQQSLVTSREVLQKLGAQWVTSDPSGFCVAVLQLAEWRVGATLVIDGLRHPVVLERLRDLVQPEQVWVVYVEAQNGHRRQRVEAEVHRDVLNLWDQHAVENEVPLLRAQADLVIENDGDLEEANRVMRRWLMQT